MTVVADSHSLGAGTTRPSPSSPALPNLPAHRLPPCCRHRVYRHRFRCPAHGFTSVPSPRMVGLHWWQNRSGGALFQAGVYKLRVGRGALKKIFPLSLLIFRTLLCTRVSYNCVISFGIVLAISLVAAGHLRQYLYCILHSPLFPLRISARPTTTMLFFILQVVFCACFVLALCTVAPPPRPRRLRIRRAEDRAAVETIVAAEVHAPEVVSHCISSCHGRLCRPLFGSMYSAFEFVLCSVPPSSPKTFFRMSMLGKSIRLASHAGLWTWWLLS